jgi:hypothetical protein
LCAVLLVAALGCSGADRGQIARALVGRGRVAVIGEASWLELAADGCTLVPVQSIPELTAPLRADDAGALTTAMVKNDVQGLLVDVQSPPAGSALAARLGRFARVSGLQGAYFNRRAALYVLDPLRIWSPALRAGLAEVARRLVGGVPPPRISSFPDAVRRLDPVEVMVLLRSGGEPRLWRSARGSSFARALLTAAAVARQRWVERSQALGGPIDQLLPGLELELAVLQDDGEIGTRNQGFVDRVILPEHGVGYERKGGWHYLLPDATHEHGRTPSRAYQHLFADAGLPTDSLDNPELRLYRLAVQTIGVSPPRSPQRREPDGLSEVAKPDEVIGR